MLLKVLLTTHSHLLCLQSHFDVMPADNDRDLTFTAALQSHFAVRYRKFAEVVGLMGKSLLQVWTSSYLYLFTSLSWLVSSD